jgi:hypothetical protein
MLTVGALVLPVYNGKIRASRFFDITHHLVLTNKAVQIYLNLELVKHAAWQLKRQNNTEKLSHIAFRIVGQVYIKP